MKPNNSIEKLTQFNAMDINDIVDATVDTMNETNGFNIGTQNITALNRDQIAAYWEGVLLVPERILYVARMDGSIAGAAQLLKPSPINQTSHFSCSVDNMFIAPWARGHGMSYKLLEMIENDAKALGFLVIKSSVRESRQAAIKLFEKRNYTRWGILPKYEMDQGKIVPGYFYCKEL